MFAIVLIIVITLIAIAFYTHCHLKPPFKKQEESLASPAPNLTQKELLTYGTSIHFPVSLSDNFFPFNLYFSLQLEGEGTLKDC